MIKSIKIFFLSFFIFANVVNAYPQKLTNIGKSSSYSKTNRRTIFSNLLAVATSGLIGYGSYELLNTGLSKIEFLQRAVPDYATKYLAGGLACGIALYKYRFFSDLYKLKFSKKEVINESIKILYNSIDLYLTYLTVIKLLRFELQYKLDSNLDPAKYLSTNVESRLQILDAAFFTLKRGSLIAKLEKYCRYQLEFITYFIQELKNIINLKDYSLAMDDVTDIPNKISLLNNREVNHDRGDILKSLKFHNEREIFDCLSEYFIHFDTFCSGFNSGIDVIDEANLANSFGHKILDLINIKCSKILRHLTNELLTIKRYDSIAKYFKL